MNWTDEEKQLIEKLRPELEDLTKEDFLKVWALILKLSKEDDYQTKRIFLGWCYLVFGSKNFTCDVYKLKDEIEFIFGINNLELIGHTLKISGVIEINNILTHFLVSNLRVPVKLAEILAKDCKKRTHNF